MCVILVGKVSELRKVDLKAAWASNPHGAGIAYPNGKGVKAIKGLMTLSALKTALRELDQNIEAALHLRFATHGAVNAKNTHPFPIGRSGEYLMHNGVLSCFGSSGDNGRSDSADLARVLGDIRNPIDRSKVLGSLSGMFCTVTQKGIRLCGSRSWVQISDGVMGSNDNFVPRQISTAPRADRNRWLYQWAE